MHDNAKPWGQPGWMLASASLLVVAAISLAAIARYSGIGASRIGEPHAVRVIDLRFEDQAAGRILVTDVSGRLPPRMIEPGKDGFVRVALRSLARDRALIGIGSEVPFRLGEQADGSIWLRDLATGRLLLLDAYGHANRTSFSQLLAHAGATP
ncbi:MAG TPA: photosynthetic complex assembly protein PuhC [Hyphomicrobiaceae bacterium]|nr:photosynthetic complex assembly protein PuhC [Hyphomicrobiaceae bacterium]